VVVYAAAGGQRNSVTIAGGVWQPGTYQVEPGMRVSELLRVAGGLRPEAYSERAAIIRTHPDSTRELLAVALSPAGIPEASRDVELLEGDQVTVFTRIESRPERYVDVSGAVGRPGRIMYADSMTVRDAVLLAGGATEDAYLLEAEVSRMRGGGSTDDTLAVVLRVPLDTSVVLDPTSPLPAPSGTGSGADVTLRPYDNVFVRHRPGWERPENVAIAGEVRFPGRYTILTRNERLSNLLERAGGLTPVAYANGIRFIRAEDDAGRVAVDLERVLTDPSHPHNLILEAGDSVFIPRFIPIVRVQGAVNSQASVTYLRGAGLDYYINSAGGFAARADKGRTFVLQPNGLIERRGRPEPGAVVTVPEKDPSQRSWLIELAPFLTGLVSLMTAAATLIIAIGP
jgi:protein involved in polysaccharide export with SLBB domain